MKISLASIILTVSLTLFSLVSRASNDIPNGKINPGESRSYNLSKVFGTSTGVNSFYLTFKNSPAAQFSLNYNGNIVVSVVDGFATIAQVDSINSPEKIKVLYFSRIDDRSSYINIGYQLTSDDLITLQIVQSNADFQYVTSSPTLRLVDVLSVDKNNNIEKTLEINNLIDYSTLSIIRSSFVSFNESEDRVRRGTQLECIMPVLAIANYILNSPCNLIDRAYKFIAGNRDKHIQGQVNSRGEFIPQFETNAIYYSSNISPYAAISAANICQAPIALVYSKRKPRQPETNDCIFNALEVLTPYLIMTNHDFSQAHFDQTISNILRTGSSGILNAMPSLESQLVTAVQNRRQQAGNVQEEAHRLFVQASALNTSTISLNEILSLPGPSNQPSTSRPQQLALGHYELNLTNLTTSEFMSRHPDMRPRVWNGSEFTPASTDFTIETIQNPSQQQQNRITEILNDWYPKESSSDSSSNSDSDSSGATAIGHQLEPRSLLSQGRNLANTVRDELSESAPGNVYFIVYYNGRPAALIQSFVEEQSEAVLIASISNPDNIALPYGRNAVRGAAQRGLQEMIKYCLSKGVRLINSNAVTAPSAHIKTKYGFKLADEV